MGTERSLEELVEESLRDDAEGAEDSRKRDLVTLAERSARGGAVPTCRTTARVNGHDSPCHRPEGHPGLCEYRARIAPAADSDPEEPLGTLDDIIDWTPDPAPVLDEILGVLARLPALPELDRVAELAGSLAKMVRT